MVYLQDDWGGLPGPGTRVRVAFGKFMHEGLVHSLASGQDGPRLRVLLLFPDLEDWGSREPPDPVILNYAPDEIEIISARQG